MKSTVGMRISPFEGHPLVKTSGQFHMPFIVYEFCGIKVHLSLVLCCSGGCHELLICNKIGRKITTGTQFSMFQRRRDVGAKCLICV